MSVLRVGPSGPFVSFVESHLEFKEYSSDEIAGSGSETPLFGTPPSGLITFRTTRANERVLAIFNTDRANAAAGGTGTYRLKLGPSGGARTAVGPSRVATGTTRTTVALIAMLTVATAGEYDLEVACTAATGNETVYAGHTFFLLSDDR